jgi:hypothetical protein
VAQGYLLYRVYIPNDPSQPDGGEPIPSLTVVLDGRVIQTVELCTETDDPAKLLALILLQKRLAGGNTPPNPDPVPEATFFLQATQDVKATPNCSSPTVPPAQAAVCAQGVMGAYYPTAFYCEKHVYEAQGWQGCLPK